MSADLFSFRPKKVSFLKIALSRSASYVYDIISLILYDLLFAKRHLDDSYLVNECYFSRCIYHTTEAPWCDRIQTGFNFCVFNTASATHGCSVVSIAECARAEPGYSMNN